MIFDGSTATATATAADESQRCCQSLMWLGASTSMDITNILNRKGSATAAAMAAVADPEQRLHQRLVHASARSPPESDCERAVSPYGSEASSSHYSSRTVDALPNMTNEPHELRYPSPTSMQAPLPTLQSNVMTTSAAYDHSMVQADMADTSRPATSPTQKAFPCSSCGKAFARRSDLARHERIHTGVRPHVCEYPGCNKQFIQRSALTVHSRVHTGEKPHMCERCGKPFSDSSSLARHRRIHSGKRPYKCPYADCQKTFTRRTTLTRHQNHHTGTVEEAAAATAAALASRPPIGRPPRPPRSDGGDYSRTASPLPTPSPPGPRNLSLSPSSPLPSIPGMPRHPHHPHSHPHHPSEYPYMNAAGSIPAHLRSDIRQLSPRSSPASTPLMSVAGRPSPVHTSHPTGYARLPPVLEPPPHLEQRQQPGNASVSPHMSTIAWAPSLQPHPPQAHPLPPTLPSTHPVAMLASPTHDGYGYPEHYAPAGLMGAPVYYPNSHVRRTHGAESHMDGYDVKHRVGGEMWTTPVS